MEKQLKQTQLDFEFCGSRWCRGIQPKNHHTSHCSLYSVQLKKPKWLKHNSKNHVHGEHQLWLTNTGSAPKKSNAICCEMAPLSSSLPVLRSFFLSLRMDRSSRGFGTAFLCFFRMFFGWSTHCWQELYTFPKDSEVVEWKKKFPRSHIHCGANTTVAGNMGQWIIGVYE